jgi:hypothetical protein
LLLKRPSKMRLPHGRDTLFLAMKTRSKKIPTPVDP